MKKKGFFYFLHEIRSGFRSRKKKFKIRQPPPADVLYNNIHTRTNSLKPTLFWSAMRDESKKKKVAQQIFFLYNTRRVISDL